MTTATVTAHGPAEPDEVWSRYAAPSRWPRWAPHLTAVRSSTSGLEAGTTGSVTALGLLRVPFVVAAVDAEARTWSWEVRLGPARLDLGHTVRPGPGGRGTVADVTISGPGVVVLPYLPLMRWALRRLTA